MATSDVRVRVTTTTIEGLGKAAHSLAGAIDMLSRTTASGAEIARLREALRAVADATIDALTDARVVAYPRAPGAVLPPEAVLEGTD